MLPIKKTHAKFSPSAAKRWMNCPGSIRLSENAPPQHESPYATEGTNGHFVLESFLKAEKNPNAVKKFLLKQYPADMVDHAFIAAQKILSLVPYEAELLVEERVELPSIDENLGGT